MLRLLRSCPSTTSILQDESWYISKMNIAVELVNQSQKVQFHYKKRANPQITVYVLHYVPSNEILIIDYVPLKAFIIFNGLLNWPNQLIH